jgi:hypothetical protein
MAIEGERDGRALYFPLGKLEMAARRWDLSHRLLNKQPILIFSFWASSKNGPYVCKKQHASFLYRCHEDTFPTKDQGTDERSTTTSIQRTLNNTTMQPSPWTTMGN